MCSRLFNTFSTRLYKASTATRGGSSNNPSLAVGPFYKLARFLDPYELHTAEYQQPEKIFGFSVLIPVVH